jgi:hypothetical protein
MGLGTVQTANSQIVQTEIFNRIWLEVNTTPFYKLTSYQRVKNGTYPDGSVNANGLSYFDKDGGELGQNTNATVTAAAPLAVYYVYCALVNSNVTPLPATVSQNLITRLGSLGPPVDGANSSGTGLNLIKIAIGFHVDPTTATLTATDPRVTTRTYVIAKRDTTNGS